MNAPKESPPFARPEAVRRLLDAPPVLKGEPAFVCDCSELPGDPAFIEGVVLRRGGPEQARGLLADGAPRVYLGEAALLDGSIVGKLAAEFGGERIGVFIPAKRMQVSWSMDSDSNADFRVMTPSVCEPCWEILRADGARSGTHAGWWLDAMFASGATSALLGVDVRDDADLNILADLTERWGQRLWLAPLEDATPDLGAWVGLGGALRLAVPEPIYQNSPYLAALRNAPETGTGHEGIG